MLGRIDAAGQRWQVFAKPGEPEPNRLTDPFDRQRLGDRDQHDLTRITPGALGTTSDGLADVAEVCFQGLRHRSRRNHHREETAGPATAMRKPAVLFASARAGAFDSLGGDAGVFELEPKHGLQVEPDVSVVKREVLILPAVPDTRL